MAKRFVFTGKKSFCYEDFLLPSLAADEVLVQNEYSLMSTGTENIVYNRLFEDNSHWDNWVTYPFYPGYAAIGRIVEKGDSVDVVSIGDRVVHRGPHASEAICNVKDVSIVPEGIDSQEAIWFALAKIAFMGAKAAQYFLGDTVLVIGAGPIGQMSIRWAQAAGVSAIISVDMVEARLELSRQGGAACVISQPLCDELLDEVIDASLGGLPDIVIDTTGNAVVFQEALKFAKEKGTVIILGDTGNPAGQHLSSDVITKGLVIKGAHDMHTDDIWTDEKIHPLFFQLVLSGRSSMQDVNTHVFSAEQGADAYKLVNEKRGETMAIIFDWTEI